MVTLTSGALAMYPQVTEWGSSPQHGRLIVGVPTRDFGAVWQPPQA
ncbi:hypothetical protein LRS06_22570 [Hymenobacter sp. J193]|nr:hypothetical protein [Hymenobacter sp. J193]MCR5890515.1 hypothetical protein [Hymenobacter sp. J193]